MFKIKDLSSSQTVEPYVHVQAEKFNYDIKNIYANTKEALAKWVQGKCKVLANNRYD
jgi:hypothetical protein